MPTTDTLPGSGWLPVEARDDLGQKQDEASRDAAQRLLALSPRERVLELMRLAAAGAECDQTMRSGDLARVLESFAGSDSLTTEELRRRFPHLVEDQD